MEHEQPRHEKVRFRRAEITDLSSFPSAANSKPVRRRAPRRALRAAAGVVAAAAVLLLVCVVTFSVVGLPGIGSERIRLAAENALKPIAGPDAKVTMGQARITLDGMRFLALEVSDVSLERQSDGAPIAQAGSVRFGVRLLPLLSGQVTVSSASLSQARIFTAALGGDAQTDWTKAFRNERGLIEPDLVANTVFAGAHRALDAIGMRALRRIDLQDVEFLLPSAAGATGVRVVDAQLTETRGDSFALTSVMEVGTRPVSLELSAARDSQAHRISQLELVAKAPAPAGQAETGNRIGEIEVRLAGTEGIDGEQGGVNASLKVSDGVFDMGARGVLSGSVDVDGRFTTGSDRVEISRLNATVGRSELNFQGLVGPRPATGEGTDEPAYRFNLFSTRSTIAPEGSPEPAMNAALQVAGTYLLNTRVLSADQIVLKGGPQGEALGTAAVRFEPGVVPGLSVAFNVHDMPVTQVKQLWPWFAARPARNWVLNNVFGGRVSDGELQMQVEPGRLGNGIPLNGSESFGRFRIEGTRFDTAGLIPPVRDATGVVDYRGSDVDIALASGTVYLTSGRTVAASDGMLTIKRANVPPVIGALDINVAGEAPAIAELASYDPINGLRHVGLVPDDFSAGQVSGNVKADIPLQKGIDRSRLDWLVALDYDGLSLAKPMDGQIVTEAAGKITVEKTRAMVTAKAKLNGIPADIEVLEPLGGADTERKRLITLTLDEKTRETVVPGLAGLVEGPVKVGVDARPGGKRMVEADLTAAKLNIPWAGWSKGPGVRGNVSFLLENAEGKTTLSDFKLSGDTFGANGSLSLSDGSLSEATFSSVKLNRNDEAAVTVKRSGRGYAVDVNGKSLDVRSAVKRYLSDTAGAGAKAQGAQGSGSYTVDIDVDNATGFHDERLGNLKVSYRGAGDRVDRLNVTAVTASGAKIDFRNGAADGGRNMRMTSSDAGAVLRFLDLYRHMQGGRIDMALAGGMTGAMRGQVDARDFYIVDDPRLRSIVSTTPAGGDRSLNQAVRRDIDTSRVHFERLYSQVEKGAGYLGLSNGVLRGSLVGASFQGLLYDTNGNMDMTGTFMPAYGLNRLFGEIPIIGVILGNGRDGGLIGVTFKLEGDADSPTVQINPLSVIAPGIFRSIFEFR